MARSNAIAWSNEETSDLIVIWGEPEIQNELKSMSRNGPIWNRISKRLNQSSEQRLKNDSGLEFTPKTGPQRKI